jgi:hypothetical protein
MSQNVANEDLASVIVYCRDQAKFVAADVEYGKFADMICSGKRLSEFCEILKITFFANVYQ